MTIREKNLSILEARFPEIQDLLPPSPEGPWTFFTSPQGHLSVKYHDKPLHSLYDPVKEARRITQDTPGADYGIVFGFGLGYTPEAWVERDPDLPLLIAEPDNRFFSAVLDHRDLTALWKNPRISLLLGENPQGCGQFQELFSSHRYEVQALKPYREFHQDFFNLLEKELARGALHRGVNLRTWERFAPLWTRNWIRNLKAVPQARPIVQLKDTALGKTALVAAAGPSLETALPYIERNRGKLIIIAVDTAFRRLRTAGIEPDILVFMDGQYWNSRHVDLVPAPQTLVVCELCSHPRALRASPDRVYLQGGSNPLAEGLETKMPSLGHLKSGGSVATTAWELGKFIGARVVYFAGLDLSYPQGETHVKGSLFEERLHWISSRLSPSEAMARRDLQSIGLEKIPSNNGSWVYSDGRMEIYRQWFEVSLLESQRPKAVNLSAQGALIRGMELQSPNALDQIPQDSVPWLVPDGPKVFTPQELKQFQETLLETIAEVIKHCEGKSLHRVKEVFSSGGFAPWTKTVLDPALRTLDLFPGQRTQDRAQKAVQTLLKMAKEVLNQGNQNSF